MAHAPPPPPRVRAVKRSDGMPAQRMTDELVVDVHGEGDRAVDVGGGEPGVGDRGRDRLARELQLAAAGVLGELGLADADDGGVARRVRITPSTAGAGTAGARTPSTSSMLTATSMPFATVVGVDAEQVGHEADAVVELDEHHDARFGVGLGRVVRHDPRVHVTVSRSTPACPTRPSGTHRTSAPGGWRTTPHAAHRWNTRRPSATASQKNWSSRVGDGGITDGHVMRLQSRTVVGGGERVDAVVVVAELRAGSRACPGRARAAGPARRPASRTKSKSRPHDVHVADDRVAVLRDPALLDHLGIVEERRARSRGSTPRTARRRRRARRTTARRCACGTRARARRTRCRR